MKICLKFLLVLSLFSFRSGPERYPDAGIISGTIEVDSRQRTYLINLPANHAGASNALVIVLHGGGGSAEQCERSYGWTAKSNASQFIVVYPDGVPGNKPLRLRTWNAGRCCGYASDNNVDDVKFISTLIDHLASKYPIDKKKIYVTGMSNGAMMAYRLACEIPEKITAIAAVSGTLMTSKPCDPSRAIPILHIHSQLDTRVPYAGGVGIFNYKFSSVDSTLSVWASANHCTNPPVTTQKDKYTVYQWSACDKPIESYITKDGGHSWPGGVKARARADEPSQAFIATDVIWDFFRKN